AVYHVSLGDESLWDTTLAWGRNAESGHATNALLIESNLTLRDRDTWFGRFEVVGKTPHDLVVPETQETFTVARLQAVSSRSFTAWNGFKPGVGGALSAGIVPEPLKPVYGNR